MAAPPYPWINQELRAGRVIPFLGAGASFGSRDPSNTPWRELVAGNWKVSYLPAAFEVAKELADASNFPDPSRELTKVAQYFSVAIGDPQLRHKLFEIFEYQQAPSPIHEYLADIAKTQPLLIWTTNYDDLMERALTAVGAAFDTVIHLTDKPRVLWRPHLQPAKEIQPKDLVTDDKMTVVYKIHGAIDRATKVGQYVITEDDYIDFLTRMTKSLAVPRGFTTKFQSLPFLFLGYGLGDWNLRVVLNQIAKARGPKTFKSWAIEPQAKQLEKELWVKRDVNVYDALTIDEFVRHLRNAGVP